MKLDLKQAASDSRAQYSTKLTNMKDQDESAKQFEKLRGFIGKVVALPIHFITVGENVRRVINEEDPSFQELVQSIRDRGLLQNLVANLIECETGAWELRLNAGERRYRACKRAGLETVPVLIKAWVSDIDAVYTGISENEERVNLSPLDLAEAYARLIEMGETVEEIAERRGRDRRTVRKYISLSEYPDDVRKTLRERPDIFTTRVLFNEMASRKFNSHNELRDHIQGLIKDAENGFEPSSNSVGSVENAGGREVEVASGNSANDDVGKEVNSTRKNRRKKVIDPELVEKVVSGISGTIPVKVKVKGTQKKGRITIDYASEDQLELLLSRFQQ
jgi:ParB/RepB/Spo0J family partition protein